MRTPLQWWRSRRKLTHKPCVPVSCADLEGVEISCRSMTSDTLNAGDRSLDIALGLPGMGPGAARIRDRRR